MWAAGAYLHDLVMAIYVLVHRHAEHECGAAFAAWKGFDSPLRHRATVASCVTGGHAVWWEIEAADPADALSRLPAYVAARTEAIEVRRVLIP